MNNFVFTLPKIRIIYVNIVLLYVIIFEILRNNIIQWNVSNSATVWSICPDSLCELNEGIFVSLRFTYKLCILPPTSKMHED